MHQRPPRDGYGWRTDKRARGQDDDKAWGGLLPQGPRPGGGAAASTISKPPQGAGSGADTARRAGRPTVRTPPVGAAGARAPVGVAKPLG